MANGHQNIELTKKCYLGECIHLTLTQLYDLKNVFTSKIITQLKSFFSHVEDKNFQLRAFQKEKENLQPS